MKPFLILQLRPIDLASEDEFSAFLKYGGLTKIEVHRIRMEKEIIPEINLSNYSGIIIGGGPSNVSDAEEKKQDFQKRFEANLDVLLEKVFEADFPTFGNCYGLGALFKYHGGEVSKENYSEPIGGVHIELTEAGKKDDLLAGLPTKFEAFGGHKEACQRLPGGVTLLATSVNCPIQMIRIGKNIYATQFHTELDTKGVILRVKIYKNYGYFSPNDAGKIIENAKKCNVTAPFGILSQFVQKYRQY